MKYNGQPEFKHHSEAKIGVLLTNLGTPEAPTKKALRVYLKQFLSDPRVVEIPRPVWWLILNGFILNTRPAKSAKLYQSIWTKRGSPLVWHTADQASSVDLQLADKLGNNNHRVLVRYAMRYGSPSIDSAMKSLQEAGAEKIFVLPLYPQYAGSTTGSTFDAISHHLAKTRWVPDLRFNSHYCDNLSYIHACATAINRFWETNGRAGKLLLSFHGLPQFHLDKGDPYHCHCMKTGRLLAEELGLSSDDYILAFQSRFGRAEWLKPYTSETLTRLATSGTKELDVFCPGFSSDCLETLEEMAVENKQVFLDAGGETYRYIPALNSQKEHIEALASIVLTNIGDWLKQPERNTAGCEYQYKQLNRKQPS